MPEETTLRRQAENKYQKVIDNIRELISIYFIYIQIDEARIAYGAIVCVLAGILNSGFS